MATLPEKSLPSAPDDFQAFRGCLIALIIGGGGWTGTGLAFWALLQALSG